jgi:hypothetical protein
MPLATWRGRGPFESGGSKYSTVWMQIYIERLIKINEIEMLKVNAQ